MLCRHGIRFPLNEMPNTTGWPNSGDFFDNFGGMLTPQGDRQVRAIAVVLRVNYRDLVAAIDKSDKAKTVVVSTTDRQRTLFTATAFVEAFVPGEKRYRYSGELAADELMGPMARAQTKNAIPIKIVSGHRRYSPHKLAKGAPELPDVTDGSASYKQYLSMMFMLLQDEMSLRVTNKALASKLYKMTGLGGFHKGASMDREMNAFYTVCTQISIDSALRMPVLANTSGLSLTPEESDFICRQRTIAYNYRYNGLSEGATQLIGFMETEHYMADITHWLTTAKEAYKSGTTVPLFHFYASHDSVIMAMLARLGFTNFAFPGFAASMIFELWVSQPVPNTAITDNDFYVRFLYADHAIDDMNVDLPLSKYTFRLPSLATVAPMQDQSVPTGKATTPLWTFQALLNYCPICHTFPRTYSEHKRDLTVDEAFDAVVNTDFGTAAEDDVAETLQSFIQIPSITKGKEKAMVVEARPHGLAQSGHAAIRCTYCGQQATYICTRCRRATYCSAEHQQRDWQQHIFKCDKHAIYAGSQSMALSVDAPPRQKRVPVDISKLPVFNLEKETLANCHFRNVIQTTNHMQVVLMALSYGVHIPWETHDDHDQFFRVEQGQIRISLRDSTRGTTTYTLSDGDMFIIPRGVEHDVACISNEPAKFYTIYAPPEHPPGKKQFSASGSEKDEKAAERQVTRCEHSRGRARDEKPAGKYQPTPRELELMEKKVAADFRAAREVDRALAGLPPISEKGVQSGEYVALPTKKGVQSGEYVALPTKSSQQSQ